MEKKHHKHQRHQKYQKKSLSMVIALVLALGLCVPSWATETEYQEKYALLKSDYKAIKEKYTALKEDYGSLKEKYKSLKSEYESLEGEKQALESKAGEQRERILELEASGKGQEALEETGALEDPNVTQPYDSLKKELLSLQQEYDSLKKKYDALDKGDNTQIMIMFILAGVILFFYRKNKKLKALAHPKPVVITRDPEDILPELREKIEKAKRELKGLEVEVLLQENGFREPTYEFAKALDYKDRLSELRAEQRNLLKEGRAAVGSTTWTVNGSLPKGRQMVTGIQRLVVRAFNSECDEIIGKVKYTNYEGSREKIRKSADIISNLGKSMSIAITQEYLDSKLRELRLSFEYQQRLQEEKENQKAEREALREAQKIQKELDAQKARIEKEQTHYETALERVLAQLKEDPDNEDLKERKEEYERQLEDAGERLVDIDFREANQKAGYVYVISNIGSFGEDVYKIGMTRRLNPQERIDELGSASVPFNFDVHAMIFSDDAPALEAALHRAFDSRKVNLVNPRKEFFRVSLEEIKQVVKKNFDKLVLFEDIPAADQYRISERMRQGQQEPNGSCEN